MAGTKEAVNNIAKLIAALSAEVVKSNKAVGMKISKGNPSPSQSMVKTQQLLKWLKNRKNAAKALDMKEEILFGRPESKEDYERQSVGFE